MTNRYRLDDASKLLDLIAAGGDAPAVQVNLLHLCRDWGISPVYLVDCNGEGFTPHVIDYWDTIMRLAQYCQARDADENKEGNF